MKMNDNSMISTSHSKNVIVGGAHSTGAIAVIRSLGRAGYHVHAFSDLPEALGLKSNFAYKSIIHMTPSSPQFEGWITEYIEENDIQMIITGGSLSRNIPVFQKKFSHLLPVSDSEKIHNRSRKYDLFDLLLNSSDGISENLPPTLLVDLSSDLPSKKDLENLGYPLFCKLDGSYSKNGNGDQVLKLQSYKEVIDNLNKLKDDYSKATIQGYVEGQGVGVFILRWKGEIKANFMHRRLHEMPHTGGASSYRESWWNEEIYLDARKKLEAVDWEGVAMIEYRYDTQANKFYLMEMNLRFWGSLHLALYSGVDFPKMLAQCFFDDNQLQPVSFQKKIKCRNTIPFEIGYLVSLLKDSNVPILKKVFALFESVYLSLNWKVKSDLLFPGDKKLFYIRLLRFLRTGH